MFLLKIDMSRAYDKVKWSLLGATLRSFGFPDKWVCMIMMYITTMSYSTLINGQPMSFIQPKAGLSWGIYHTFSYRV